MASQSAGTDELQDRNACTDADSSVCTNGAGTSSLVVDSVNGSGAVPVRRTISLAHIKRSDANAGGKSVTTTVGTDAKHEGGPAEVHIQRTIIDLSSIKHTNYEPFMLKATKDGDGEVDDDDDDDDETYSELADYPHSSARLRPNSNFLARYVTGLEKVNEKSGTSTIGITPEQSTSIEASLFRKKGEATLRKVAAHYGIDIVIQPQTVADSQLGYSAMTGKTASPKPIAERGTTTKPGRGSLNQNAAGLTAAAATPAKLKLPSTDAGSKALLRRALSLATAPNEQKAETPAVAVSTLSTATLATTGASSEGLYPPTEAQNVPSEAALKAKRKRHTEAAPQAGTKTIKKTVVFNTTTDSRKGSTQPKTEGTSTPTGSQAMPTPKKKKPRPTVFQQAMQGLMTAR